MKKYIKTLTSFLLALILIFSFSACNKQDETSSMVYENEQSGETSKEDTADNVEDEIKEQFLAPVQELIETYKKGEHVKGVQPDFPEGADFPEVNTIEDFRADYDKEQGVYFVIVDLKTEDGKIMMIVISATDNKEIPFVINGIGFSDGSNSETGSTVEIEPKG